jgi:hypothetical protein
MRQEIPFALKFRKRGLCSSPIAFDLQCVQKSTSLALESILRTI